MVVAAPPDRCSSSELGPASAAQSQCGKSAFGRQDERVAIDDELRSRRVWVRGPDGDAQWNLAVSRDPARNWTLELSRESPAQKFAATEWGCFGALTELRRHLDSEGLLIGVNGARRNASVSGMLNDMAEGTVVYLLALGARREQRPPTANTLDPAALSDVTSVDDQAAFKAEWLKERLA